MLDLYQESEATDLNSLYMTNSFTVAAVQQPPVFMNIKGSAKKACSQSRKR
jgi:hypothetical protein